MLTAYTLQRAVAAVKVCTSCCLNTIFIIIIGIACSQKSELVEGPAENYFRWALKILYFLTTNLCRLLTTGHSYSKFYSSQKQVFHVLLFLTICLRLGAFLYQLSDQQKLGMTSICKTVASAFKPRVINDGLLLLLNLRKGKRKC